MSTNSNNNLNGPMAPTTTADLSRAGSGVGESGDSPRSPRVVLAGPKARILCIADIRGDFHELNRLIKEHEATAVIHTGDFGFLDQESLARMADKILRHLIQYSPLLPEMTRKQLLAIPSQAGRETLISQLNSSSIHFPLSQLPHLISGAITFSVPVFTNWGLIEDVRIVEKMRTGEYSVKNLYIIDEASAPLLEVGGLKLRLHGLGGALAHHKLFDTGEGYASIAGGQGTMWTTALQIGELVDTATKVYNPSETRLLVCSAPISRHGLLTQLSLALKIDLTVSGGLHFSYNDFSLHEDFEAYRQKLVQARDNFAGVYQVAKDRIDASMNDEQRILFKNAQAVTQRIPNSGEDPWTSTWNFVLTDVAFGHLILSIADARVSAEMKSQGLNFSHRTSNGVKPPSMPTTQNPSTPVTLSSTRPQVISGQGATSVNSNEPKQLSSHQHQTRQIPSAPSVRPPMNATKPPPTGPGLRPPTTLLTKSATPSTQPGSTPTPGTGGAPSTPATRPLAQPIRQTRGPGSMSAAPVNAVTGTGPSKDKERVESKTNAPGASSDATKSTQPGSKERPSAPPAKSGRASTSNGPSESRSTPVPAEQKKEASTSTPATATATTSNGSTDVLANGNNAVRGESAEANKDDSEVTGTRSPPPRKVSLFLKGLPSPTSEDDLRTYFGEHASKITNVKLVYDPIRKIQKNFAYVDFSTEADMQAALSAHSSGLIRDTKITAEISNPPTRDYASRGARGGRGSGVRGRGGSAGGRGHGGNGSGYSFSAPRGAGEGKEGKDGKGEVVGGKDNKDSTKKEEK